MLFPVNLWIFELKRNISVPIGWSYFIGWLVLILYFSCGEWSGGPCGTKALGWVREESMQREGAGSPPSQAHSP